MPRFRNAVNSSSKSDPIRSGFRAYRLTGLEYWRASRPGLALGSWHPTSCTNFCGADTLPRNSPPCCDMAPQRPEDFPSRSVLGRSIRSSEEPFSQTNFQPSAGRVCGSGFHCQHRCCHCPRLLSFVEEGSQRASARKVARRAESARTMLRFIRRPVNSRAASYAHGRKPLRTGPVGSEFRPARPR